jgi:hypothetical protein
MSVKTKKATFNIHTDILDALDEVMMQGMAPSKNALIEQALIKELKNLKQQARITHLQEAIKDPLFLKDIEECKTDFRYSDSETTGRIDL